MSQPIKIAVIGSGYVGLVAAVCFAEMGHEVICVDNDELKVGALQGGDTLIHEKSLPELLERHLGQRIRFSTDLAETTRICGAIFIAVGTPQSESGDTDLSYVKAVAGGIASSIESYTVIVEKSTVPVYTNEWIRREMESKGVARNLFDVVSNPEFLREGTAVSDFLHPDRIVVGADSERAASLLERIYSPLTTGSYYVQPGAVAGPRSLQNCPPLLLTSTKSAEIIKHASNAFLAMKISFINAVSNLCEAVDADVEQVSRGMGLDHRIGHEFLSPGIGYGGSCFPKDVAAFRAVAEKFGLNFDFLTEIEEINGIQKERFFDKIRGTLQTLRGKRVGVLGLAFKGGTDDIRESPAIRLVEMMLAEGASIAVFDPAAMVRAAAVLPAMSNLRYVESSYAAAEEADAVVILTDWKEFAELDMLRLYAALGHPIVIDGRNLFDPRRMAEYGFTYVSVGRPTANPVRAEAKAGLAQT